MTTEPTTPPEPLLEVLALTAIKPHPDNPRVDVGDVTDLAASIDSVGLLEPLVVAPPHDGITSRQMGRATYLLIAGHRRLAAAKKARRATVPALVRTDLTTRAAQIEAMLVENLQRTDLTPVEEADAYQLVIDLEGLTQTALAAKLAQPVSRIRDRLKLTKIGDAGRAALQAHQVTIEQALAISEFDDDPKAQKRVVKAVGTDNFRHVLHSARIERDRAVAARARLDQLTKNGVTVLPEKPKAARDLSDLIPGFPSYGPEEKIDAAEKRVHKDCPGRVSYRTTYGSIRHGCTQPKLHPKSKPAKSDAELERDAELRRILDDLARDAGAAGRARAEFVRDRLATPTDPVTARDRVQAMIVEVFLPRTRWGWDFDAAREFLEVLGAPVPEIEKGTPDWVQAGALGEALDEALRGLGLAALVLALDLAIHLDGERILRNAKTAYPGDFTYDAARPWVDALTGYGYRWSDWERARFVGRYQSLHGATVAWTVDGDTPTDPQLETPAETATPTEDGTP